jgi:Asp-tRNA(Asn)/Glu-tRNA(Gln) amidotransferase A subunit family amidase
MSETSPLFWPVSELLASYRDRTLHPVDVVEEAIARIEELDGNLHAYVAVLREEALAQADAAGRSYRNGDATGPLLGVPVSIKDLFDVAGAVTTMGSLVYRDRVAAQDSGVVARLREAGAVLIGKTNTAEFGQSATTENLLGPPCGNPWDVHRTAGGSSGGAAVSVAAGFASVALGSDGGGSIRIPAAFCGVFGMKPTFGLVQSDGGFSGMSDFACPGPIARSVADARALLEAMTGTPYPAAAVTRRLRVAWCARPEGRPVDPRVGAATAAAVELLAEMGHDVVEATPPLAGWMDVFSPLVLADEWRERRDLLESAPELLTVYARNSIQNASALSSHAIDEARALLVEYRRRFDEFFRHYDLLVTPTTATVAFPNHQRPTEIAGEAVDRLWGAFPFTAPFNVSGCPAASVHCGVSDGLPIGLQVVGPQHGDALVLDVSEELEAALGLTLSELEQLYAVKSPREETAAP